MTDNLFQSIPVFVFNTDREVKKKQQQLILLKIFINTFLHIIRNDKLYKD